MHRGLPREHEPPLGVAWEILVLLYCTFALLFGICREAAIVPKLPRLRGSGTLETRATLAGCSPPHGARGLLLVPAQDQGGPEACELAELRGEKERERER